MTTNSSNSGPPRPYACIACTQRKVKCDKCHPCAACSRSRLPCRYSNTPPSRQRRKRKAGFDLTDGLSETLLERLRAHEAALLNAGIPFQSFDEVHDAAAAKNDVDTTDHGAFDTIPNSFYRRDDSFQVMQRHRDSQTIPPSPALPNAVESFQAQGESPTRHGVPGEAQQQNHRPYRGVLLSEDGGKRYYEHGFIGVMGQEYRQQPVCSPSNDSVHSQGVAYRWSSQNAGSNTIAETILTPGTTNPRLGPQSPNQLQLAAHVSGPVARYWFTFLENVHPLTKIIHAPSVEPLMLSNNDVEDSSPISSMTNDALKYSICSCAISSLTDRECKAVFGEAQAALLHAFQSATRHALSEASFLRVPDVDLLCAHVLLLTSMFHNSDRYSLWTVMGSTIRMAQSQGLHRDGVSLELPPFKVEMRRRLWWYIVSLDQRLSELVGAESCLPQSTDTMLPCNCNDADLTPDMTEVPIKRLGATEMTFCQAKYEIVRYLYERGSIASLDRKSGEGKSSGGTGDGGASDSSSSSGNLKKSLTDLKSFLEENFLRFCDPVVSVQFLATMVTRSTICKLMQMALHRIARPPDIRPPAYITGVSAPASAQAQAAVPTNEPFQLASRNLEYDNLIHSSRSLRGFLWYVRFFIPWGAPVYVLKSLASRGDWDQAMQSAWTQIEELYEHHNEYIESDTDIHLLVGELTLQAWATRENFLRSAAGSAVNAKWSSTLPPMIPVLQQKHRLRQQQQQQQQHNNKNHNYQQGPNRGANIAHEGPYIGDFSGLDPLMSCLPDFVDPLFVPGEWVNWAN